MSRARNDDGPWSVCYSTTLLVVLALFAAFPFSALEGSQGPPIGVRVATAPGWEDVTAAGKGAAVILKRRGDDGGVVATFNVVISEGRAAASESIADPGVAEGLERELLGALAGARVVDRGYVTVGGFKAYRLTVELAVGGSPKVLRQTTIDVRRGVVTTTAVMNAAVAGKVTAEVDGLVSSMTID
jgi:hypothetical protein